MVAVHVVILVLHLFAAYLSARFVRMRRLGRPWLLVTAALAVMGTIQIAEIMDFVDNGGRAPHDARAEAIELSVSLLFASGFCLTDRWFLLKERLEGRFRLIADVDGSLVGVMEEGEILSAVCDGLTRGRGYTVAWIGVGRPDGTVEVARCAGGDGPSSWIAVRWDDTPEGRGPTGTALRTGIPSVVNDLANDPRFLPWREVAVRRGLRSGAAVRIDAGGELDMVLTIYSRSRNMFDRFEMAALSAMAHRSGTAIVAARRHRLFVNAKNAYEDLLKSQRDGVILVRGERIVRANPAAAAMLGHGDADGLVGEDPASILADPDAWDGLREPAGGAPGGGRESAGCETAIRRRDGSTFPGEVTATWVPRPRGVGLWEPDLTGPLGMIIVRDATERRRLETQIIEMQKMEAVGTLAGGVAHDFNNILTGILGNLDLARSVLPAGSNALPPVQESIQASERAAQLIRQLLEFSRRSPLERMAVDLSAVAGEVVHLFLQTIDKRIEVRAAVPGGLWPAAADSNQVHQVLMNLCVNARDAIMECLDGTREPAAPPGGHMISLGAENAAIGEAYCRARPDARPGEFVLLSIADTGAGMDEATQRRVFEPFFTTKKLGRGTGLGLSTVYGIVKQHDGWIELDSRPGKGTTFRVYFPRAADVRGDRGAAREEAPAKAGHETILLVDDEEMIRDLACRILEINGYTVITACDGLHAIDTYVKERDRIDLVILDMTMPRLSGLDVLERILRLSPKAKVILSSGYLAASGSSSYLEAGASAFLQKPYRAEALARAVRAVLDAPPG